MSSIFEGTMLTFSSDMGEGDLDITLTKCFLRQRFKTATPIDDFVRGNYSLSIPYFAFQLRYAFTCFSDYTIHVVLCDIYSNFNGFFVMVMANRQVFIAPNNGVLSLALNYDTCEWVECISVDTSSYRNMIYSLSDAINDLRETGEKPPPLSNAPSLKTNTHLQPTYTENSIRAHIIHIDGFGNAVTNISKDFFSRIGKGRGVEITLLGEEVINAVMQHYGQVSAGTLVACFNSMNLLEIAVAQDNASRLLGLQSVFSKSTNYISYKTEVRVNFV